MKYFFLSILTIMMLSISPNELSAQNKIKTDTLTVLGNCSQCKTRIEDAAYVKGVKQAEWNKHTKVLTVIYSESKTDMNKISQSISQAGHDTRLGNSSDKDYNQLPDCCAYRSGACHHE
ncbi:MAG: cation transporter [Chitinophagaceae bacterium]|nr:MAG: TonB-dependent receptor [Bacteroidetes bacterium OLB11]MCC6447668.1 cation transporter [Chitinophagaceae bacterium]